MDLGHVTREGLPGDRRHRGAARLLHDSAFDGIVFHPFTFGSTVQPWQEEFLRLLGAAGIPVVVISEPVRVEHLLVPSRPITPSHSATAEAVTVWQHLVRDLTPPQSQDLVFLSRSHLARDLRRLTGDLAMEQLLSERGFQIVHPETMTVTEQLGLVRHARLLAGVSGSSLHLSAFADRAPVRAHPFKGQGRRWLRRTGDRRRDRPPDLGEALTGTFMVGGTGFEPATPSV